MFGWGDASKSVKAILAAALQHDDEEVKTSMPALANLLEEDLKYAFGMLPSFLAKTGTTPMLQDCTHEYTVVDVKPPCSK